MADFALSLGELTKKDSLNWDVDLSKLIELMPDAICLLDDEGWY